MSDHLRRFREYMNVEARFLAAAADRARVLDHRGNRGSDAEHAFVRWLRDRVEPGYTVSAGEVVDSFQTDIDRDSRQHDAIIHENTRFARRFSLQSGLRLVPIESVASVTEIKLDVDATKFKEADEAASQTARLRLAVDRYELGAGAGGPVSERFSAGPEDGLSIDAPDVRGRIQFALFAFSGPKEVETLAGWVREAKTIKMICCLGTGCAYRPRHDDTGFFGGNSYISSPERALIYFAELIGGCVDGHEHSSKHWRTRQRSYSDYEPLIHWDVSGYRPPHGYHPGEREIAQLIELGHLPKGWTYPSEEK